MDRRAIYIGFIIALAGMCFGTFGDINLPDNAGIIYQNNSQTVYVYAHPSASESYEVVIPAAKGTAGQAVIIDSVIGDVVTHIYGTPSTSANHDVTGSTHDDAKTATVVRGDVMIGNTDATALWDRIGIGAANTFFKSDGTDPAWGFIDISDSTNLAVDTDHLKLTGDTLSFSDNEKTIAHDRQDSFLEQIDFTISEAGGTVTGSLEKEGTGDLTQFWSDDFDVLDCTPAKTVNLTAFVGASDALPTASFVYILFTDKTTLVAASSWPANSVEHIRVASIVLQTAATTGTGGALMNRNWNDPSFGITNPKGGSIVSNQRVRKEHAKWDSGVALTVTGTGTGTITLDNTAGVVFQLNPQTFPALDMAGADDIHIVNQVVDEGGAYESSVNLFTNVTHFVDGTDAGTAIGNNKYFNVVIWGIQNRDGEFSHLMLNLPTGQYTLDTNAIADVGKFSVRSIPSAFTGTGFLISELTFRLTGGGTTWTLVNENSLLGDTPGVTGGSGTTTTTTVFSDASFLIFDNGDDSKEIQFQASAITTGNIRVITMANANVDLADIATNTTAIGLNTTHRSSDGTDHSDVVLNNTHRATDEEHINTGSTVPGSPTASEMFLHTPTGRMVLLQWDGSAWIPLHNEGTTTLFVDGVNGVDGVDNGWETGTSNAFATIQFALDSIAGDVGGNVTITIAAATYNEDVIIQGKSLSGDFTITLQGTLTTTESVTSATVTQGATTVLGTVADTELDLDDYTGLLCYFVTDDAYRLIDAHVSGGGTGTMTLVGYAPSGTNQNVVVNDWGTLVDSFTVRAGQFGVVLNDLEIIEADPDFSTYGILFDANSKAELNRIFFNMSASQSFLVERSSKVFVFDSITTKKGNVRGHAVFERYRAEITAAQALNAEVGGFLDLNDLCILRKTGAVGTVGIQGNDSANITLRTTYTILENFGTALRALTGSIFRGVQNAQFSGNTNDTAALESELGQIKNVTPTINIKTITVTASSDAVSVSVLTRVIFVDTNSATVVIGGLNGGQDGQVIRIAVIDATNNTTLEHNEAAGTEKIFLNGSADDTITADFGGWVLAFEEVAGAWFEAGK